ncbi:hypothetical protein CPB83DRAFT_329993 [Crepidotus variabilis]|uniref:Uncharacterized protein n=1 Tax=Crepidotus variabilis TaxID=179855 RepID=A0A9P6ET49_9AGAR|nr:hypothetical protein CPB83DRAFT_329993 [Crepidotus variabilis]
MANPAAFSRLQLAAALIEYDNDPDDPDAPHRSAKESAIFAHLRRNPAARPDVGRRKSDYLEISLPSEGGTTSGLEPTMVGTRRSRRISKASTLAMKNPFGVDGQTEMDLAEEDEEQELEVDLQSWGLDAFMPKDKKSAKAKGREPAASIRSKLAVPEHEAPVVNRGRGVVTSRSMNLEGQFEFENATIVDRRRSFGSPLELVCAEDHDIEIPRRRAASRASLLSHADPTSILPFPTSPVRSPTPGMDTYETMTPITHERKYSTASLGSRYALDNTETAGRRQSMTSIGMGMLLPEEGEEENPFTIERPTNTSRFDPKAVLVGERPRSHSNASLGSRMMLENDVTSIMTGDPYPRDRPYSTMDLLRPKVLVMPSPLQSIVPASEPTPAHRVVEGFESSKDGPPLPPGARATRRLSASLGSGPLANAFTPNPMMDLTPSQKIFRNTLVVGGQSPLLDSDIPRAREDGEQIILDPVVPEIVVPPVVEEPLTPHGRPAGKLYGKSLIDDLEARKQEMRGKQRVFRGDERPSMMARTSTRSSTFIDPATLKSGPKRVSSFDPQSNLTRNGSQTMKPLLTFDSEENLSPNRLSPGVARAQGARSVFGTDTLWESEMEKLKIIQVREAEEEAARHKFEAEAESKKDKKGKRKKKGKGTPEIEQPVITPVLAPVEPPTLPDIQRASTRRPLPKPDIDDEDSESDDDPVPVQKTHRTSESWHAGSSDEEGNGPRRTTGVGLRYPSQRRPAASAPDEDSDEDVPLAATVHKAIARATMATYPQDDSDDEDKPLVQVLQRAAAHTSPLRSRTNVLPVNKGNDSDDDDQPLGLRTSRIPPMSHGGDEDEDDMPLAFHPEQQRRTQFQMFTQQQQQAQQQQMMMQAQMQNTMYMNAQASMMGSFYGVPPVMGPMPMMPMQAPIPIPSPPPLVDEAKFGRVDRWRRDVAVDGSN